MEKSIKLKTRNKFSALDTKAQCAYLNGILKGSKINNCYTIDSKTYLFKFGRADLKFDLLIESGVKFLSNTKYIEKNDKPNGFILKLRKYLKSLFVKSFEQIGVERVAKLTFCGADPEKKEFIYHLFIELYAKGNIVFTDSELKCLAVLRQHVYSDTEKVAPNERYPIEKAAQFYYENLDISKSRIEDLLKENLKNWNFLSKLLPCLHQSIGESFLWKEELNPNGKFDENNKTKLAKISEELLSFYQKDYNQYKGYLYYQKDQKNPFEFSPVKLFFVRLLERKTRNF